ncbi:MAG: DUF4270 domain-containing protein, partial [Saprospiraceae bacterium]|nr:DUF4270 domain-containing protein [Saprospiraceae bacterium]
MARSILRRWAIITIVITPLVFLFSACEEPDIVGMEVHPDIDNINIFFSDTASILSYSEIEDSLRTDETDLNLLGSYKDPVFGTSTANFCTQLRLSSNDVSFGTSPVFDSLVLSLVYNGYYGDNSFQHNVMVYELIEDIYSDSDYYSFQPFLYDNTELANITFVPNFDDSVLVDGEMQAPQLRINLNQILGDKFLQTALSTDLSDNDNFLKFFKGLYLKVPTASSGGSILYFDTQSALSKLTLYYHNSTDTTTYNFVINENCARVNMFDHNDYIDADNDLKNQIFTDTNLGQTKLYIQSMGGIRTKLQFPNLKNFFDKGKIAINSALLIVSVDQTDLTISDFEAPARLRLVKLDKNGVIDIIPVTDAFVGDSYFGGFYNETKKEYQFNLQLHIQEILNGDIEDYG